MTTLENPSIALLGVDAEACLLSLASFHPSGLPVDLVDVDHGQTCGFPEGLGKRALSGAWLADNHDPSHAAADTGSGVGLNAVGTHGC